MIDRHDPVERDQHVDRLLRDAMRGPVRADTADCLDVEALAAWSEGSLAAGERARAEAHAATCTRCQAMLAAMIRSEPIVEAASASPFRKWLMILGPALGAAAAVALWFAVDRPARPTDTAPVQTMARVEQPVTSKDSDKEELKARAEPGPVVVPNPVAAPKEIAPPRSREVDQPVANARSAETEARKTLDRLADAKAVPPSTAAAKPSSGVAETVTIAAEPPLVPPLPTTSPPPPPASPARADQVQAAQAATQSQSQSATQNVTQALPSPSVQLSQAAPAERRANETGAGAGSATGGIAGGRGGAQDAAVSKRQAFLGQEAPIGTFDLPTSNPQIRYRVLEGRTVQRTTDAGKTWATGHVVLGAATLRTGIAPSPTVCWLAGTGGLVLMTADGRTWRESKLPVAVDIKSIAAGDANTAIVILADGRSFTTTTGGLSWNRAQ